VAAVAGLTVAHGGLYGAVGETLIALAIAVFFLAIWLRERRRSSDRPPAEMNEDEEPI
jgi:hypothetical protein